MPKSIIKLTLDTSRENRVQEPIAVQKDYGSRFLEITFTTLGEFVPIPGTAEVTINATRKDGASKSFSGEVNADGTVQVPITQWMTELDDRVTYTVSAITDKKLSTTPSTFMVKPSPDTTDTPEEDTPEADLLAEVLANENARQAAEATRVSNETARKSAENARQSAETQRLNDEATRVANESARVSAESSRDATFKGWAQDIASLPSLDARISANADRITNLEAGIPSSLWAVDDTAARVKDVPTNARPRAIINKIGGMSYKSPVSEGEDGYFSGLRDAKVTGIKSVGVNIWDEEWTTVSWTKSIGSKNYIPIQPNTKYRISASVTNGVHFYDENLIGVSNTWDSVFVTPANARYMKFYCSDIYGTTYKNDIILHKGSTALPYVPYTSETITIPPAVQSLDGWGQGIPDTEYYNFVDWRPEDGVTDWHEKAKKRVFDGTENWKLHNVDDTYGTSIFRLDSDYGGQLLSDGYFHILCNIYKNVNAEKMPAGSIKSSHTYNTRIYVAEPSSIATADEFKEKLQSLYAAGTPMEIVYTAIEKVTDISDLLPADNLISVEGGGTITFENEYGYDVPNTVTYMLKEETA